MPSSATARDARRQRASATAGRATAGIARASAAASVVVGHGVAGSAARHRGRGSRAAPASCRARRGAAAPGSGGPQRVVEDLGHLAAAAQDELRRDLLDDEVAAAGDVVDQRLLAVGLDGEHGRRIDARQPLEIGEVAVVEHPRRQRDLRSLIAVGEVPAVGRRGVADRRRRARRRSRRRRAPRSGRRSGCRRSAPAASTPRPRSARNYTAAGWSRRSCWCSAGGRSA